MLAIDRNCLKGSSNASLSHDFAFGSSEGKIGVVEEVSLSLDK